jgi:hypothetical protein
VALEVKALEGDGVEIPAALVAVTATLRKMAKHSKNYITAIENALRQLRGPAKCFGPTPKESVVAVSGLAELLACLGFFRLSYFRAKDNRPLVNK